MQSRLLSGALGVVLVACGPARVSGGPVAQDDASAPAGGTGGQVPSGGNGGGGSAGKGGSGGGTGGKGGTTGGSNSTGGFAGSGLGNGLCGLANPAFCDNFNTRSNTVRRMGELATENWSGGRLEPNNPSAAGAAMPIGKATLPEACHAGVPGTVFPDRDTLICDPTASINSNYLLMAVAAQNYGENSFRIRQPFDFSAGRGTIVFDADANLLPGVGPPGWISVEVTEDPVAVPSYAIFQNDEGGPIPRNAFELQFRSVCGGGDPTTLSLDALHVFTNYVDEMKKVEFPPCVSTKRGSLNHFVIHVSKTRIEVLMSDYSADGVRFATPKPIWSSNINLPFTRGYVHITTHNHATIKYASKDAAFSRWDNVGFDGPVIKNWREYDAPNSLTSGPNGKVNIGYVASSASRGVASVRMTGVNTSNVSKARLTLTAWYSVDGSRPASSYVLRYRVNGKAWHDHTLGSDEGTAITAPKFSSGHSDSSLGAIDHVLDVPVAELVSGDNQIEFDTANVPTNLPPVVANVTLVLTTN